MSEFVIYCINTEVDNVMNENSIMLTTLEDKKIFLNAILNPPAPNRKLKKAQLKFIKMNGAQ